LCLSARHVFGYIVGQELEGQSAAERDEVVGSFGVPSFTSLQKR
jgi:hypothetical protein